MQPNQVIVCMELRDGRLVSRVALAGLQDAGDPAEVAARYAAEGADGIMLIDVSMSQSGRQALLAAVPVTAERLDIPLSVGGRIHELADIALALQAGADKVVINTAAAQRPELIREASGRFGSESIITSIEARLERRQIEIAAMPESASQAAAEEAAPGWFRVFTHAGRTATEMDAITWARQCAQLGAGAILISGIDKTGARTGFDLELIARVAEAVQIPVIAAGGASGPEHIRDAFLLAGADAVCAAAIFHGGGVTIGGVKRYLASAGIRVRLDLEAGA